MKLSVVIITHNEGANIARTLASVQALVGQGKGEIIVVDSGSTDRTVEIAKSFGAKVFVEEWKGFAAQKNSAIDKATGDWVLSLDADEEVDTELRASIATAMARWNEGELYAENLPATSDLVGGQTGANLYCNGFFLNRRNYFLGRQINHGGFWPDQKLRLFRRGSGRFEQRSVHETVKVDADTTVFRQGALIHHSYPTLSDYIEHMNRYSSLGAEMVVATGKVGFSVVNIVVRPLATFLYNYIFRLGFLDGREGLLLHLYHAVYVSWKYAKAWELSRTQQQTHHLSS